MGAFTLVKNRKFKIATLLVIDIILILVSYYIAFIVRFYHRDKLTEINLLFTKYSMNIIAFALIYILVFYLFKQYNSIWTLAGYREFINGI